MRVVRGMCIAVLGISLLTACSGRDTFTDAPKPAKPSAPSFDGTYRFDFDGAQQLAGGEPKPTNARVRNYAVRSACTDSGCIATATKLADDNPKQKANPPMDLVLDFVGGSWHMALREDSTCGDTESKGPQLTVWSLQPQPDGTLTGTSSVAMNPGPNCAVATQTPVTVTRIGNTESGISVADPAKQKPLSPSAPSGLSGHYSETSVLRDSAKPGVRRVFLETTCVRNTDQCATFKTYTTATAAPVVNSLLFANGKWTLNQQVSVNCPSGATASTIKREEYSLPKPATQPLPQVTGTVTFDVADACPAQHLDITLERTGD